MDAEKVNDKVASAAGKDRGGVMVSRRRFARAGLSGSVVLGSLASKPVLGASTYHCTVSGQISGNLSRPGLAADCMLGEPPSYWASSGSSWPFMSAGPPAYYVKGILPDKKCKFGGNDQDRGTNFNDFTPGGGVPLLKAAFFIESTGSGPLEACSFTLSPTLNPATMLQVLSTTDGGVHELGRVVVASLLNAASVVNYPVTAHTIVAMFNATFVGMPFYPVDGNNSVTWSRTRVIEYLASLFKS